LEVYAVGMKIVDLRVYPVKSCRGRSVETATIAARGFQSDRRAMIVAQDGSFVSQRTHPNLTQIEVDCTSGMSLSVEGQDVNVSFERDRKTVRVWNDEVSARIADEAVNSILSEFLGEPVCLVSMDDASHRTTSTAFGAENAVSFADGFPYLITTTASLRALGETAGEEIPMDRFRSNIVIETETPWIEDSWSTLDIDGVKFDLVKPCTRCVMTTLDQKTGKQVGKTTMEALIKTRARSGDWGKGVVFGVNAIARTVGGTISRGMTVRAE